jgi:hypothetical protein
MAPGIAGQGGRQWRNGEDMSLLQAGLTVVWNFYKCMLEISCKEVEGLLG